MAPMTPMTNMTRRIVWVAGAALLVVIVVRTPGLRWDFTYDWLTARATISGVDPHLPLDVIADKLGLHTDLPNRHPRTPGALVLQAPIALVPWPLVVGAGKAVVAVSTGWLVWLTARLTGRRAGIAIVAAPVLLLVPPFSAALRTGNTGILVAALIGWTWLRGSGWGLGLAITLKVWPWLLVPALFVAERRRAAYEAATTAGVLNVAGLALPHVSFDGTAVAFADAYARHADRSFSPFSFPFWVAVVAGFAFVALLWWRGWSPVWAIPFGLAVVPVLWATYLPALAIPIATRRSPRNGRRSNEGGGEYE